MKCLHPITIKNPSYGKTSLPTTHQYIEVPCGRCYACQANRRRVWSFRLWTELMDSRSALFLTLTYDDGHVPKDNSPHVEDIQKFFKRLRKNFRLVDDRKIKYFACGEYGTHTFRPHYHALLFNLPIPSTLDFFVYWQRAIEKTWDNGFVTVAPVNGNRIGYVTKYILKQVGSAAALKSIGLKPRSIGQIAG